MHPSEKVIFISTHTENKNYFLQMASTMAESNHSVDFILVEHNDEPVLQMPFKLRVIKKYFRLSFLQCFWMYFKILWLTLFNIRSNCVYVVEDISFMLICKFLGNTVVYYQNASKYNYKMDVLLGNVFLAIADLILIKTQSKTLQFEKIALLNCSPSSGVKAITTLLYKNNIKRIVRDSESFILSRNKIPRIIKEETEQVCSGIANLPEAANEEKSDTTDERSEEMSSPSEMSNEDILERYDVVSSEGTPNTTEVQNVVEPNDDEEYGEMYPEQFAALFNNLIPTRNDNGFDDVFYKHDENENLPNNEISFDLL